MTQRETLEYLLNVQLERNLQLRKINATQAESLEKPTGRVNELLSRIAWLNRQLFGRKSEKPAHPDPNQLSCSKEWKQKKEEEIVLAREAAIEETETGTTIRKQERCNRKLLENLPVIEPENLDPEKYKRIGEERTRTLEFEP
jgi:hypothetical protein